jgi:hypothetical protein
MNTKENRQGWCSKGGGGGDQWIRWDRRGQDMTNEDDIFPRIGG